ncbi:MAG: hypothetical protein KGH56_00945 [Patescibacteria group bacterium]|nr:hypothetical protein [Patescibacteria group bacterium]
MLTPHSFAATIAVPLSPAQSGFVPLAPIPGLTSITDQNSAANSANLAVFFNNLYKFLIGIAAVLAVIEIIWGGLEISTQDSISKQKDGKKRIQDAIFGLVLVLSPVLVFSIINPSILNLSLNLPALNLATPPIPVTRSPLPVTRSPQRTSNSQVLGARNAAATSTVLPFVDANTGGLINSGEPGYKKSTALPGFSPNYR